ncbi:hypothetical protein LTR91_001458 [Friedmanniomyces endolithicus]|uniref:Uncharacterized protein n=1 Tax=Friedmanniomyces endolithicus TaxID=329885 RepID=A0AAN6L075_9PEZI|nr:hypothetical protein LTS09_008110 [Friedmanniomyces endolithicus]KAK0282472.1 hypothetical protein LTR35_006940 [Friedmanniomyces endolithicus]KAK0296105.1 hypothetical protein LTS00_005391 [Friedmanniomyces endolithicus]KAK0316715.1 hypothetical protein LTR01_000465 [Friedmanniomyces endolithicus]KAK0327921.1 hypothetical protein LTR82_001439 [Friedmanniomyces endolithicus]
MAANTPFSSACPPLLSVLATSTFAHEIPAPEWDKYAGERGRDTATDALPMEYTNIHAREAVGHPESDAMHAWEQAHNGQPMKYEAFGERPEVHGHYFDAREVPQTGEEGDEALSERDGSFSGARHGEEAVQYLTKSYNAPLSAHEIPDFGDSDIDTSLEGYDHNLAQSMMSTKERESDDPGSQMSVRNEFVRWTGILPTTEMHFPPSPTPRPSILITETQRSQHSVRDVLGMWWDDLKGGVRHVLDL